MSPFLKPGVRRALPADGLRGQLAQEKDWNDELHPTQAAFARLTPLLLGLGLRSLSTNASSVPLVKQAIRSAEIESCVRFARQVLDQTDPARVSALIAAFHASGV